MGNRKYSLAETVIYHAKDGVNIFLALSKCSYLYYIYTFLSTATLHNLPSTAGHKYHNGESVTVAQDLPMNPPIVEKKAPTITELQSLYPIQKIGVVQVDELAVSGLEISLSSICSAHCVLPPNPFLLRLFAMPLVNVAAILIRAHLFKR